MIIYINAHIATQLGLSCRYSLGGASRTHVIRSNCIMLVFDFMLLPIDIEESDTLEIFYSLFVHIRFLPSDKLIVLLLLVPNPTVKR